MDSELSCLFSSRLTVGQDQVEQLKTNLEDLRKCVLHCRNLEFRLREKVQVYLEHIVFESKEEVAVQTLLKTALNEKDFFRFLYLCDEVFVRILRALD